MRFGSYTVENSSAGGCYQTPARLLPASIFRLDQKRVEAELEVELLLRRDWGLLEPQAVEAWWAGFEHPLRDSIPILDITNGIAAAGLNSSALMLNGVSPDDDTCFGVHGLNALGQVAGYLAEHATANVSIGLQYRWSMYWTTSLVLGGTQLYEEESPLFFPSIAIFFTICGLLMLAFILQGVLKLMQDSHEAILYRTRLQGVRSFLKGRSIPRELRTKVVDYFEYCAQAAIEPSALQGSLCSLCPARPLSLAWINLLDGRLEDGRRFRTRARSACGSAVCTAARPDDERQPAPSVGDPSLQDPQHPQGPAQPPGVLHSPADAANDQSA